VFVKTAIGYGIMWMGCMEGSSVARRKIVSLQMTPVASKLALIRFPRIPRELFRGWGDLDEGCDGLRVAVEGGADGLNRIIFIEEDSKPWMNLINKH
jgi:hypothetical protein